MLERKSPAPGIIITLPKEMPEITQDTEIKYALSMPHLFHKINEKEYPAYLAEALIALKKIIPDGTVVKVIFGGGSDDFFCKIQNTKLSAQIIASQITNKNCHDKKALQEIIKKEMDVIYDSATEEKIKACETYLKTLPPETLPNYKLTTFKEDIKQFDGQDELRPNFQIIYDNKFKKYKENPALIDKYCLSLLPSGSSAEQNFNRFSKIIEPIARDVGLKSAILLEVLHNCRVKFFLEEDTFYACHNARKGIIFHKNALPDVMQDTIKASSTKAGILSIQKSKKLSPLASTAQIYLSTLSVTTPCGTNLSPLIPSSESPISERSDSSKASISSSEPATPKSHRSDSAMDDSKYQSDSATPKTPDSDESARAAETITPRYHRKSLPLQCPKSDSKKNKPPLSRSFPREVSVPPPPSPGTTKVAFDLMLFAAQIAQSGNKPLILETHKTLESLSRSKSVSPERRSRRFGK